MSRKSEILFLLVGNNPLPNYVAARLLSKQIKDTEKPIICLIYSTETSKYADYLKIVLGADKYLFFGDPVNPWDFTSIKREVEKGIAGIRKMIRENPDYKFSVGLNYTGGTKAMAVHAYRAMNALEKEGIKVYYSYLDSNDKAMRFDVEDGSQNIPVQLNEPTKDEFETVKISLEHLLALHGFRKLNEPNSKVTSNYDSQNLPATFKDYELEEYVLQTVNSLKTECGLDYICSNLNIINPEVSEIDPYCEIDVVAIRGYQLFAISCTTAKIDEHIIKEKKCPGCKLELNSSLIKGMNNDVKHILTHKIFQVALRAKELGGAEAKNALVSMADSTRTVNLNKILKNDHIKVFGKDDLKGLKNKLKNWFEGN